MRFKPNPAVGNGNEVTVSAWVFSWPLSVGALAYLFAFLNGKKLLGDGDTYWHIAAGQWILEHRSIPTHDHFSHTMRGTVWTAHEWLSEVLLAIAHDSAGMGSGVVGLTALAFAATLALLNRALLKSMEPVHALLFTAFAFAMTAAHLIARPHIIAMPLMMIWTIGLVRASESGHAPSLWLLPVMTLWANLHGGFTLGLALALAFAVEGILMAKHGNHFKSTVKSWTIFLVLSMGSALITPHGIQGIFFTWQMLFHTPYALGLIAEWQSPNFQKIQLLEIWLLAGLALVMYKGFRLPPIRLVLLLGLLHLALKHSRNVELLGLLTPLFLASPLSAQLRLAQGAKQNVESVDAFFKKLAQPAGRVPITLTLVALLSLTIGMSHVRPLQPPESAAPIHAIEAAQEAGIKGAVLNSYHWGGYLIYRGIPPFIDGRADMYGDDFIREYVEALALTRTDGLDKLVSKYKIGWTLLPPDSPAVALLDHLPDWRRLYADKTAVVHVKAPALPDADEKEATSLPPSSTPIGRK